MRPAAKYRPGVPILVLTKNQPVVVAGLANMLLGMITLLLCCLPSSVVQRPCEASGEVPPWCSHPGADQEPGSGQCMQHDQSSSATGAGGAGSYAGAQRPRAAGEFLADMRHVVNGCVCGGGALCSSAAGVG